MRRVAPLLLAALLGLLGCGAPGAPAETDVPRAETASPSASPSASPTRAPASREQAVAPPRSVEIAALGLREELVDLGLTPEGALEVPADPDRVGWFSGGGRPGGSGPTVVVGHVDSDTGPAVFAGLRELGPGDEVVLTSDDGRTTTYAVTEVGDVPQQPFPTEQVFGATVDDVLRLITCTGPYDDAAGRYTENRIVTAVPVT